MAWALEEPKPELGVVVEALRLLLSAKVKVKVRVFLVFMVDH